MELAQRFKKQLEKYDIYAPSTKEEVKQTVQETVTKPVEEVKIKPVNKNITCPIEKNKFNSLKNALLNKISKTPYWDEFAKTRQESMIGKYIDASLNKSRYSDLTCSKEEKISIINEMLR